MNGYGKFESGTVKFFSIPKQFGFLTLEGGEEIFFHYNDARRLTAEGSEIRFAQVERSTGRAKSFAHAHREPKTGDEIVFQRDYGRKGSKASPWTFASEYAAMQKALADRPLFRAYVQYSTPGGGPEKAKLEWEGQDIWDKKLTSFWNPKYDRGNFSNGDLDIIKWFEVFEDGQWKRCFDPRTNNGRIKTY